MDVKIYKYYLSPGTGKYLRFMIDNGISMYNVADVNTDKDIPWLAQDGTTDLKLYEIIQIGRAIEYHSHVVAGRVEYDPYFIWSKKDKKDISDGK